MYKHIPPYTSIYMNSTYESNLARSIKLKLNSDGQANTYNTYIYCDIHSFHTEDEDDFRPFYKYACRQIHMHTNTTRYI